MQKISHPMCMYLFCLLWLCVLGSFCHFTSGSVCSLIVRVKCPSVSVNLFTLLACTLLIVLSILGINFIGFTTKFPTFLFMRIFSFTLSLIALSKHGLPLLLPCIIMTIISWGCDITHHYWQCAVNVCIWCQDLKRSWYMYILKCTS